MDSFAKLFIFIPGIFLFLFSACNSTPSQDTISVENYYAALNTGDFEQVRSVVADSFAIIEGDYITTLNSRAEHHVMFQWDSVFAPTYNIKNIQAYDSAVEVLVSTTSLRYAYLENNPLTCEMAFSFKGEKLSQLSIGECPEANWEQWESRRDSLVSWIDIHHPELTGFIHDLTKEGAENYMKAIALYTDKHY